MYELIQNAIKYFSAESRAERKKQKEHNKFIRENTFQGLIPGDVIENDGDRLMYMGINKHGGPGRYGIPEPIFRVAEPSRFNEVHYIRGKFFEKVDHISPEQWSQMCEEVKAELSGQPA